MNVVFNRAKRKGFQHGRKQPCITVLKQVGREDTNVVSPLFTVVL